ncbi:IclR family transcriptional regulator [Halalkalicoccus tibetensis]|uniref:IclR family transcriptional regulator n=1 Tax=Halalkalicoccus tibetensis TaxID=175632 RepID=A0ABD5V723_9EURY
MERDDTPVKATKITFEIIDLLRQWDGAGVSEIANYLEKPTSTVHDHLQTLESEEYLINDNGVYRIGARFLELGEQARSRMKVYHLARPEVDNLAEETGNHSNFMIEEHGRGIFMYKAKGENAVRLDTRVGMRVYLQTTALGKTILAHRPTEEVENIVERHGLPAITENTITDRDQLFAELAQIKERGYAIDDEERVQGMRCIAAPIIDEEGEAVAAVSVSGPKNRFQGEYLETTVPNLVLESSNVIEVNLTYT